MSAWTPSELFSKERGFGTGWAAAALLFALTLIAPAARSQIAFVQATAKMDQPAGTTVTSTAFAANPKIGNKIIVVAWTWGVESTVCPGVTDSLGNKYTLVTSSATGPNGGYGCVVIYSAPVTSTGANFKVTVAFTTAGMSGSDQIDGIALEYSGIGVVDLTNTSRGTAAASSITTAAATSVASELVISGFVLLAPAANYSSITPSGGYTQRAVQLVNAGDAAGSASELITSSTGIQSTTWTANGAFSDWATAIATFKPSGVLIPDHYSVTHSATGVNCQAEPVTISAHSNTHTAVATTDQITVSTSTGRGDFSLTTGSGSFVAGASNAGTAKYTFATADNGVVVLALKDTYPETVTVNVADGTVTQSSGSAIASENTTLAFSASGFRITNGANSPSSIGTRVAGLSSASGAGAQSLALQAIRTDTTTGACTSVFASGTTASVSLAYQCNNPTSCIAGQTLSVTNNGTTTNLASNPSSGVASYTSVPLKFSTVNAEAPISLLYTDAGQVSLYALYNIPLGNGAASGNTMTGSSQFVVQPAGFTLSNIKRSSDAFANPASTASGTVFLNAGQSFTATVTAVNSLGNATPNYGREVVPETPALTPSLVLPATGHNPAISGSFGAFTAGVGTGTTFSWPEVGIIKITPVDSNYLSSGAVTGTASGNVGRFIPNGFGVALNTPVIGTSCSAGGFGYVGQPFTYTVAPVITATAQALGGATTQNYSGALMRLTNGSLTGRTYTPTPASPALTLSGLPAATADPAIVDLGAGQVGLTFSAGTGISYTRGSAAAPFAANIALSINVIDLDGAVAANPVTFGSGTGMSFSTGATQYYGRLFLRNALGSELLDLPMSLTTQYYLNASQGFVTNSSDVCSAAPTLSFSAYQANLNAGETCARDTGSPGVSGVGCSTAAASGLRYRSTPVAGDFNLILGSPGAGNNGAVTVTAATPSWLQYLWNSASGSNSNPSGMATFGLFPGPKSRIYTREVY